MLIKFAQISGERLQDHWSSGSLYHSNFKEKKIFLANIQDSDQTVYNVASVLFVHCLSISSNTTPVAYY